MNDQPKSTVFDPRVCAFKFTALLNVPEPWRVALHHFGESTTEAALCVSPLLSLHELMPQINNLLLEGQDLQLLEAAFLFLLALSKQLFCFLKVPL